VKLDPIIAILVVFIAMAALLFSLTTLEEPNNASGEPHHQFQTMRQGGDGLARSEPLLGRIWLLGVLQVAMYASFMTLAVNRRHRDRRFALCLAGGCVAMVGVWSVLLLAYQASWSQSVPNLVFGFPTASAWMLYGVWTVPVVFVAMYRFGFRRWIYTPEDQRRFEALLIDHGATDGQHLGDDSSNDHRPGIDGSLS